jgi:hypothetical protein
MTSSAPAAGIYSQGTPFFKEGQPPPYPPNMRPPAYPNSSLANPSSWNAIDLTQPPPPDAKLLVEPYGLVPVK